MTSLLFDVVVIDICSARLHRGNFGSGDGGGEGAVSLGERAHILAVYKTIV